ncbi:cytochrome c [Crocinitomicaceae bacterium CZZ-1]|uniref:Cytochrome c n=1 Tax=Taishania pollutisoli TaxID=2766479 RepID=A0A8J6P4P7_9FLAO|nr:cytochrome c [Taishania pollutisoli]MBC9811569.1 cytochrome c [Taishania pollutisoli]
MENNWNQLIERYLNNEFSAEGKVAFENELAKNTDLQAELELHKLTVELLQRHSLRTLVKKSGKWYRLKKQLVVSAIALTGIILITAIVYLLAVKNDTSPENQPEQLEHSFVQQIEQHLVFANIPAQYFEFTGTSDVFLSETGVLLSLTEHSFLLNGNRYSGEAIIQWQEAQTPSDFAKAGLSTKSGDRLLETQGMFSLTAFTPDGKKLDLSDEGVYIQVPVDNVKEGMKLFKGVPQPNGDVDWQDPVELERLPKQKNMNDMDLYPSRYEPKLNELKWHTDKKKRDSLYLSFEGEIVSNIENPSDTITATANQQKTENRIYDKVRWAFHIEYLKNNEADIIATVTIDNGWYIGPIRQTIEGVLLPSTFRIIPTSYYKVVGEPIENNDLENLSNETAEYLIGIEKKAIFKQRIRILNTNKTTVSGTYSFQPFDIQKAFPPVERTFSITINAPNNQLTGEQLFKSNCATCHSPHTDGTAPKLKDVRYKWEEGGAKAGTIYEWVRNWEKAAYGDPYAMFVAKLKPVSMNKFPSLTNAQIDAIFDYVDCQQRFIPPSKVLAIWNSKFNKTNLATQDFEDRMKFIHETCDQQVLDVYVKNLSEPLWKLDEQVVGMGYTQFQEFATQRVGKIKINDAHQKNLDAFYNTTVKRLQNLGKKRVEEALRKEQKWDHHMQKEREKAFIRKGMRENENLSEEFGFNLKNVYRQLGITVGFRINGSTSVNRNGKGNGTAIVNIDKYVMEATIARQSTVITDPKTGKTAQITYKPVSAQIDDYKKYDKLFLYLFSKEMNSYQRLDVNNGILKYNLNGDMNYSAAIIGMSENGYFYHQIDKLSAVNLGTIALEEVSQQEFDQRINALNNSRINQPMSLKEELQWLFKEKANYKVQQQRRKEAAFRNTIRPTVFPCFTETKMTEAEVVDIEVFK